MKSWTVLDRAFIRIYSMACLGLLWRWSEVSRNWIKSSLHYYKCPRRVQIAQSTSDSRSALLSTTTIGHDNDGLHNPYVSHWDPFTILSWIRRQKSIKWSNENRFSGTVASRFSSLKRNSLRTHLNSSDGQSSISSCAFLSCTYSDWDRVVSINCSFQEILEKLVWCPLLCAKAL